MSAPRAESRGSREARMLGRVAWFRGQVRTRVEWGARMVHRRSSRTSDRTRSLRRGSGSAASIALGALALQCSPAGSDDSRTPRPDASVPTTQDASVTTNDGLEADSAATGTTDAGPATSETDAQASDREIPCDALGDCPKANGQTCSSARECVSGHCILGSCGIPATDCSSLSLLDAGLVTQSTWLEKTWPAGNPAGQAVLVGGQFSQVSTFCFDQSPIAASYQDPTDVMIVIPSTAALGTHSLTVIDASGAVDSIPVNVVSDFGSELAVVHAAGAAPTPVFGHSATPYVPKQVGNYPPLDNYWRDELIDGGVHWVVGGGMPYGQYGEWDGGIIFGTMDQYPFTGGITGVRIPGTPRLSVSVTAEDTEDQPDARAPTATGKYVGLFVCGIDTSRSLDTVTSTCKLGDAGIDAAVVGNPDCQVSCDANGFLRVLLFPDAPSGHQVLMLK